MTNEYEDLFIKLNLLIDAVVPVTGYWLTKTIVVGEKEAKRLMSGHLEIQAGDTNNFYYRKLPIRKVPEESYMAIEIGVI